jgi:carbamoyl-phosphate synthase small subunit
MLILKDKSKFAGRLLGSKESRKGTVVLYTGVVGYQEVMTDPANAGKIVVMTYPLIGNYGINHRFNESGNAWCEGIIIKEKSRIHSNFQAESSFEDFLKENNITCLSEVDTRTLSVALREKGEQEGVISGELNKSSDSGNQSFLKEISVKDSVNIIRGKGKRVAVIDLGVTNSFLKQLEQLKCDVWLFPFDTPAKEILQSKPDRIIICNGPEEDAELDIIAKNTQELLGKVPLLGISTGHIVIAKAQGAKIRRLKIGHRGVNYPVIKSNSNEGEITVQNHALVVDEKTLDKSVEITERNLNDKTVEKMQSKKLKFISVQYYLLGLSSGKPNKTLTEFIEGK